MSGPYTLCARTIIDRPNAAACEYANVAISEAIFPPPYEYRGFVTSGTLSGTVSSVGNMPSGGT